MTEYVVSDDLGEVAETTTDEDEAYTARNRLEEVFKDRTFGVTERAENGSRAEEIAEDILADDSPTMTEYVLVDDDGEPLPDHSNYTDEDVAHDVASRVAAYGSCYSVSVEAVEIEENGAENSEADDSSTMTQTYDFMAGSTDEPNFDTIGNKWTLGDHSSLDSDTQNDLGGVLIDAVDSLDGDIDGEMLGVLEDATDLVTDTNLNSFQCPVEACGLSHSHADHKHDIRDDSQNGLKVRDEFAEQMDFCPYCHCGVNELSMLMEFYSYIAVPVFADAERFDGVQQLDPDDLEALYRAYEGNLDIAVRKAGVAFEVVNGVEQELEAFFNRRQTIESAANSAPIPQETRTAISNNRDKLEEATSQ